MCDWFMLNSLLTKCSEQIQILWEKIPKKKLYFRFDNVASSFNIVNAILTDLTMEISEILMVFFEFLEYGKTIWII